VKNRVLLIPAAGRGSRLQMPGPKLLAPVGGMPMIDRLVELYREVVDRFVLVLHPSFLARVKEHCADLPHEVEFVTQEQPTGMLDALVIPAARIASGQSTDIWITWCDQVALRPSTIRRLAALASGQEGAAMTLPTIERQDPYIHFARGPDGRIVKVLQRREGDPMPEVGESDVGLFRLSLDTYVDALTTYARQATAGTTTRERNFLPFIPWLARRALVCTFPAEDVMESVGINTPEELRRVESYLQRLDGSRAS